MRSLLFATLIILPLGPVLALGSLWSAVPAPLAPIPTVEAAWPVREPSIPPREGPRLILEAVLPPSQAVVVAPSGPSELTPTQRSLEAERLLRQRPQLAQARNPREAETTLEGVDQRLRDLRAAGDVAWSLPALEDADDDATFARHYVLTSEEDLAVERWMLETRWLAERERLIDERLSCGRYVDVGGPTVAPG